MRESGPRRDWLEALGLLVPGAVRSGATCQRLGAALAAAGYMRHLILGCL